MTDGEITQILVAIGQLEDKVDRYQKNIDDLYTRSDELRSQLDKLQQSHDDRLKSSGCTQVNFPNVERSLFQSVMRPTIPMLIAGGLALAILLVLRNMGLRF